MNDSVKLIGNEIGRIARWKKGPDLGTLAGQPIQLQIKMKDADLYAMQFVEEK